MRKSVKSSAHGHSQPPKRRKSRTTHSDVKSQANVGWVVWLAAGLVCDTAITVTAKPPPQMTSTMTTMSVMISPVFRFGGGGGGG